MTNAEDTGRVLILAGDGKGKTTSALGTALRAVGRGLKVLVIQFIKAERCGEHAAAERLAPDLEIRLCGTGMLDRSDPAVMATAQEAAANALGQARDALASGEYGMVVLDEVLIAVKYELVSADAVRSALTGRAPGVHAVLTGNAPYEPFADLADTITLTQNVKHAFQSGRPATPGVES